MVNRKLHGSIIVTYRCNAKCSMCSCWEHPTKPNEEIAIETIRKLPKMKFVNITGGEPFLRDDISEIVGELYKKTGRIVISTNGSFSERIIKLCERYHNVGIRISIEGLKDSNDKIRGIKDGFNKGYKTLERLVQAGHKDIGFAMTVQDTNADDLVSLYNLGDKMGMEFATAVVHNSFYFRKTDNKIVDKEKAAGEFSKIINLLLRSMSPKKWFRAYFNHGLINYIYGNDRLLPCEMGSDGFFMDPYGDILPCNGMEVKESMGNLNTSSFDEIWNSSRAEEVRNSVKACSRNCWMIGSVSPAMKKSIWIPLKWVIKHKITGYEAREGNGIGEAEL